MQQAPFPIRVNQKRVRHDTAVFVCLRARNLPVELDHQVQAVFAILFRPSRQGERLRQYLASRSAQGVGKRSSHVASTRDILARSAHDVRKGTNGALSEFLAHLMSDSIDLGQNAVFLAPQARVQRSTKKNTLQSHLAILATLLGHFFDCSEHTECPVDHALHLAAQREVYENETSKQ